MRASSLPILLVATCSLARGEDWSRLNVPGTWEDNSPTRFASLDGFAWYRARVSVPETWRGADLELYVEHVDNAHEAFWNGVRVGGAGSMPPAYKNGVDAVSRHRVPGAAVKAGVENLLAIRVYDEGGRGGFKGASPLVVKGDEAISLTGGWAFRAGDDPAWAREDAASGETPSFSAVVDARTLSSSPRSPAQPAPLEPEAALRAMRTAAGLAVDLVLAEPAVRQPLSLSFDERGRLWVVQYIQYPHPAGITMLSHDGVWRAHYDRVPPPPPNHFRGLDKVTIHEDADGDGVFEKETTFLEGLNIATSVALGRGGVWVLNPPYLLFYHDKDGDDVPDSEPEVHLTGFGLEDTHSVANSLHWGPDGWLYAAQGSTVTGNVRRPGLDKEPVHSMGQLIWRYHPETRRYEVFAEGGGNAFGVEIDARGRVFSGHNGGDTRGFHYVQGGYYQKGFNKHGALSNPYAFGYFPAMKHNAVQRFTHTFVIYEGGALGEAFEGRLFGVAPLLNHVVVSDVEPDGSSVKTHDVAIALASSDPWFRPVDVKIGPDGALYVADWYDFQCNHYRNHEGQIDASNGRVYRLRAAGAKPGRKPFDLSRAPTDELIGFLSHENRWWRETAKRLLGDRKDRSAAPRLLAMARDGRGRLALESLWALNLCGGLDEVAGKALLDHREPDVRRWTVRLLCDEKQVSPDVALKLLTMALIEPDLEVRSQLASSARRLPAADGLPIVRALLARSEDSGDIHVPLLLWWAIEAKADSDRDLVLALFEDRGLWSLPVVEKHILERILRRFAQAGTRRDLAACSRLLELAPGPEQMKRLVAGLETALAGRSLAGLPADLTEALDRFGGTSVALGIRRGRAEAIDEAIRALGDEKADPAARAQYAEALGALAVARALPALLDLASGARDNALRSAALASLRRFDDPAVATRILEAFGGMTDDVRAEAASLLASRPAWALALLEAAGAGRIDARVVPADAVRRVRRHRDARVQDLARKLWGEDAAGAPADLEKKLEHHAAVIRGGVGVPKPGKAIFVARCARCHTLFGEGGKIGPDLTTYKRDDIESMLLSVVRPSAEVREGFETYTAATRDGLVVTGFLVEQDARLVTLRGADGKDVTLEREQVLELAPSRESLMPEGLLEGLTEQDVRDLFAYLRSTQPLID